MTKVAGPSLATLERLGLMAALLGDLVALHRERVSSNDLARWLGTTAATVRKDLSWTLGGGGTHSPPGLGGTAYPVLALAERLATFLHPRPRAPLKTALAGLGDWGLAVADELKRSPGQYQLVAGFDSRANRLETLDVDFLLYPTTEVTSVSLRWGIELAVLAVPAPEAQKVAERFVQGGVKQLVNYTSVALRLNRRQVQVRDCGL